MKKSLLLILVMLTLTACSQTEAAPSMINTPIPPTATFKPPATHTPEPSPTPTLLPYYLEEGSLYDLDDNTGEYVLIAEGIAEIATSTDGSLVAHGEGGEGLYRYNADAGEWEAVEKEFNFCNAAGLKDKVVNETEKIFGKSLRDFWEEMTENDWFKSDMGVGESLTLNTISGVWVEVSMSGRQGFQDSDVMLCANAYFYDKFTDSEFMISTPIFATKDEVLLRLANVGIRDQNYNWQLHVDDEIKTIAQAREFMNENLKPGTYLNPRLRTYWGDGSQQSFSEEKWDNVMQVMPDGYLDDVNARVEDFSILRTLGEESDGLYSEWFVIVIPSE